MACWSQEAALERRENMVEIEGELPRRALSVGERGRRLIERGPPDPGEDSVLQFRPRASTRAFSSRLLSPPTLCPVKPRLARRKVSCIPDKMFV